jgi:phosphoribosylformylglycinamidine cyclo-ligase
MYRTFNCGLGMTICVAPSDADRALAILRRSGEQALLVGEVQRGGRGVVIER